MSGFAASRARAALGFGWCLSKVTTRLFAHGLLQTHSSDGFRLPWPPTGCLAASLAGRSDAMAAAAHFGRMFLARAVSGGCPVVGLFAFAQGIMEFAKGFSLPCVAALEAWTYD